MGTVVEIVGANSYWREIISPQPYKAWVTDMTLVEMSAEELKAYEEAPKYIYTAPYGHVYTTPANNSQSVITDLVGGDVLRVAPKVTDSANPSVEYGEWVEVILPSDQRGWVLSKDVRPLGERTDIRMGASAEGRVTPEQIEGVIRQAYSLRGVPYLWGGMSSKGVDCSGLVRICFLMNDIMLPRNASQQAKCGKEVALKDLQRGDLIFFGNVKTGAITHVGIYLGNDEFIHSSHMVRVNSLNPEAKNYYKNSHRLLRARRLCY
jgi:cell wall-associated NlpC family hydrolase